MVVLPRTDRVPQVQTLQQIQMRSVGGQAVLPARSLANADALDATLPETASRHCARNRSSPDRPAGRSVPVPAGSQSDGPDARSHQPASDGDR